MKQFEQLKRAFASFKNEYAVHSDSRMFISGITADFDRIFELSWKTIKEYLDMEEYHINRETVLALL